MKIIVTIKWVGAADQAEAYPDGTVSFAKAKASVSEYDAVAIHMAKSLACAIPGAQVVGIALGPSSIATPLARKAMLARGLDRLVLVADDAASNLDCFQTATVLSAAIKAEQFDLVLCGDASADEGNRQVPAILGALLAVPVFVNVRSLAATGGSLSFTRQRDNTIETLSANGPLVLSVLPDAVSVPVPGMKDILAAAKKPSTTATVSSLCHLPPSAQVLAAGAPPASSRQTTFIDTTDPAAAAHKLLAQLRSRGVL